MPIHHSLIVMFGIAAALTSALQPTEAKGRKDKDAAQPFIVESRISAPKRVGEFLLEKSYYDPSEKYAGASFRYELPDHPEIRFDLFVYPAGDMRQDTALKAGMEAFVKSFDARVKLKYYSELKIIDSVAFDISPSSNSQISQREDPSAPAEAMIGADARRKAIVEASLAPKPLSGKRIDLRYNIQMEGTGETVPMRSRGYLFYKQLYYFKGRISVAESRLDQAMYEALSDRAMRELVPAVRATNIGGCAKTDIVLGGKDLPEGEAGIDQVMAQLLDQVIDKSSRNCHATRAEAKAEESGSDEVITIEYAPDDWSGQ